MYKDLMAKDSTSKMETRRVTLPDHKHKVDITYTGLSILLATFNYRARGTCGLSRLNHSLQMRDE